MKTLFKSLNNLNNQYDDVDVEHIGVNCKYYQIDKLHRKIVKNSKFSLLHLNIVSLGVHVGHMPSIV